VESKRRVESTRGGDERAPTARGKDKTTMLIISTNASVKGMGDESAVMQRDIMVACGWCK